MSEEIQGNIPPQEQVQEINPSQEKKPENTTGDSAADEKLKAYIKQADELLNIEEITVVYKGVKQPQTPSQLSVELSALRNLTKMIDARIASLENDWALILEKQRIVRGLIEAENKAKPPVPPQE